MLGRLGLIARLARHVAPEKTAPGAYPDFGLALRAILGQRKMAFDAVGAVGAVEKVLRDSKVTKNQVHDVVLVGGSTRIPKVVQLLTDFFNGARPPPCRRRLASGGVRFVRRPPVPTPLASIFI